MKVSRADTVPVLGFLVAAGAVVAGVASTGLNLQYFLQPTGGFIVLGGTLGVILVTTPARSLPRAIRRAVASLRADRVDRPELIEQILLIANMAWRKGLLATEEHVRGLRNEHLREALLLAIDAKDTGELRTSLEMRLRMNERHGEADARALEIAGGYAPTLGILGTVVGLIEVLRHFSDLASVGAGIGTAFVSTMYGLGLANLVLLPCAHRIRAVVFEDFETQELIFEGVLAVHSSMHPTLIRLRLQAFLREKPKTSAPRRALQVPVTQN